MKRAVLLGAVICLALAGTAVAKDTRQELDGPAHDACFDIDALAALDVDFADGRVSKADMKELAKGARNLKRSRVVGSDATAKLLTKSAGATSAKKANQLIGRANSWCRIHRPKPPATTTTTAPPVQPQVGNGTGDSVIDVTFPPAPAVLHIMSQGSSNFIVQSFDATDQRLDLLVNTIGGYDGVVPLNFLNGQIAARLQIQASGPWAFDIKPLAQARGLAVPGHLDGRGDDVVLLRGSTDTAHFANAGDSNFIVTSYGTTRSLLVNEIGGYDGTVIVPSESSSVIEVRSNGAWSADFS